MTVETYIVEHTRFKREAVQQVIELFDQDCTIPFIARYRKDKTGNLDELDLEQIAKLRKDYNSIVQRKNAILKSLEDQGVQNHQLISKIEDSFDLSVLEDLFLPYKKTRAKKADIAREHGLEPLAKMIMAQNHPNIESVLSRFTSKKFSDEDAVVDGALDIVSAWLGENISNRSYLRANFWHHGRLSSKAHKEITEEQKLKYRDYLSVSEGLKKMASHRFLALQRAENESAIQLSFQVDKEYCLDNLYKKHIKSGSSTANWLQKGISRSFSKILFPVISKESIKKAKERADTLAVQHFSSNLEQLLLSSPLGEKRILALDPGFRTGCKLVCLDEHGTLLHNETIYPHKSRDQRTMASKKLRRLIEVYKIEAVAVGDGTAGKETHAFVKEQTQYSRTPVYMVDESGASIYSASPLARKEFPEYDITVRGAVSIGRRLMDPLAELIKIDPKSIGVGQYQHDVDQNMLKDSLENTVIRCVNAVGINLNTASESLLSHVSGLSASIASKIVAYRDENNGFKSRKELLKVKGLGAKTFQQSAPFLRVKGGEQPLDNTWVHPENYDEVNKLFRQFGIEEFRLEKEKIASLKYEDLDSDIHWGEHTFNGIKEALLKPGLDLRKQKEQLPIENSISDFSDLKTGMKVQGKVKNITQFGAFVDIGIKENGLIHVSKIFAGYVDDIHQYIKLNQVVTATVISLDEKQKRIGLSLIEEA